MAANESVSSLTPTNCSHISSKGDDHVEGLPQVEKDEVLEDFSWHGREGQAIILLLSYQETLLPGNHVQSMICVGLDLGRLTWRHVHGEVVNFTAGVSRYL